MEKKTYLEMDYPEFDALVEKHYGVEFEVVASEEWGNDQAHVYTIKKEEFDQWDTLRWENFLSGKEYMYMAWLVFQKLVNDSILPEGTYLLRVSW